MGLDNGLDLFQVRGWKIARDCVFHSCGSVSESNCLVCFAVVAVAAVVAAAPEFPHPASITAAITAEPITAITFMPFFFIIIFSSTFLYRFYFYVCIYFAVLIFFNMLFSCSYIVEYTKVLQ